MIAKRVPGQLSNKPMVLVRVFPTVREDEIGRDGLFQILKYRLYVRPGEGHKAVAKAAKEHAFETRWLDKAGDGLLGLAGTDVDGAEHDPIEDAILPLCREA
jgi:hypothetical protein